MTIIGPDGMDAKRELGNHGIDKVYGFLLGMTGPNFQGPDSREHHLRSYIETDGWFGLRALRILETFV